MTIFLYILGVLWAVGTLAVAVLICHSEVFVGRKIFAKIVAYCLLLPIWVIIGLGPLALIKHESGPELATLLKSEWQCVQAHTVQSTTYVQSGQVLIPVTSTSQVCDVYARR